jgi:hypothetical protein
MPDHIDSGCLLCGHAFSLREQIWKAFPLHGKPFSGWRQEETGHASLRRGAAIGKLRVSAATLPRQVAAWVETARPGISSGMIGEQVTIGSSQRGLYFVTGFMIYIVINFTIGICGGAVS